jgi:hypothetical protein
MDYLPLGNIRSQPFRPYQKIIKLLIVLLILITLAGTLISYPELSNVDQIRKQNATSANRLNQHITTFESNVAYYQLKYDRDPPKRFRKWFEFAQTKKCFTHISMYDPIYKDLAPFIDLGKEDFNKRLRILTENSFESLEILNVTKGKASIWLSKNQAKVKA